VHAEELTPRALLQCHVEVLGNARLRVKYDEFFLDWLFREMAAVPTRGTLVRAALLRHEDRLLGWYVGYLKPRGLSRVMDIQATRGKLGTVLDYLFADAWDSGSDAVEGRLEPSLYEPLSSRGRWLHYTARALFHSLRPAGTDEDHAAPRDPAVALLERADVRDLQRVVEVLLDLSDDRDR
jgi:hypothetical protein